MYEEFMRVQSRVGVSMRGVVMIWVDVVRWLCPSLVLTGLSGVERLTGLTAPDN